MMTKKAREEEIIQKISFPKKEREIHREIGIDNSLCSKLLHSLESQGYIELRKIEKKGFRNFKEVILTEKGKEYKNIKAVEDIKIEKTFDDTEEEELEPLDEYSIQEQLKMESMGLW
jgi:DNA-binding MarR family transcriptional regulator